MEFSLLRNALLVNVYNQECRLGLPAFGIKVSTHWLSSHLSCDRCWHIRENQFRRTWQDERPGSKMCNLIGKQFNKAGVELCECSPRSYSRILMSAFAQLQPVNCARRRMFGRVITVTRVGRKARRRTLTYVSKRVKSRIGDGRLT